MKSLFSNVESLLWKMDNVPHAHKTLCLMDLKRSKEQYKKWHVGVYKFLAPIVTLPLVLRAKWEDESLPEQWWKWDNNISLNGDRANWAVDEFGEFNRSPVPLEKGNHLNDNGELMNYYAPKKLSPRHWFSRWIWIGWRNRASNLAKEIGPTFYLNSASENYWTAETDKGTITVIEKMGHYQFIHTRKWWIFEFKSNLGYKLNNLNVIDRTASLVYNPFSFKIRW